MFTVAASLQRAADGQQWKWLAIAALAVVAFASATAVLITPV